MDLDARVDRNKRMLVDLFSGSFPGHAIIMEPELPPRPGSEDFTCSEKPLEAWVAWALEEYEARCRLLEALDDDSVPYMKVGTGTHIFAAAFGCPVHCYPDAPPCALPAVTTAAEADRLKEPGLDDPPLDRIFEFAAEVRRKVPPDVPVGVPDIQSPFDIAALVWRKQDLFVALYDRPDAATRLIDKCHRLLKAFLSEYARRMAPVNLCECPTVWSPPELGAYVSEDEAGSLSVPMFERFCLPYLVDLSTSFGGLFVHCCAAADHQYASFRKIPNLRGINRLFQAPGPGPAIEAFSGRTVLMMAWTEEEKVREMLTMARPDTRFLFNMPARPLAEARGVYERLRRLCPRLPVTGLSPGRGGARRRATSRGSA